MEAEVRPLALADVPAAAALALASDAPLWDETGLRHELGLPHARLAVLTSAGEVVGFSDVWRVVDEVHLLMIAVRPDLRRRGLGKRLLDEVVDFARASAAAAVLLEVRAGNVAAQGLYAAFGFVRTGRRRRYYADGEDALLFELRLRP